MSRLNYGILCLGILAFGVGASLFTAEPDSSRGPRIPDYTTAEMQAIASQYDHLKKQVAAQQDFQATVQRVVCRLIKRHDLRRATAEVHAAACTSNPHFLTLIGRVEPGATDRERLAHSLIRKLQWGIKRKEYPPEAGSIVEQIQAEVGSPGFLRWCAEANFHTPLHVREGHPEGVGRPK
jgi:hypothetical protein